MKLTRIIPARKETFTVIWCRTNFMTFGVFKNARIRAGMKYMKTCFWCHKKFDDNEMLALTCFDGKGNKMMCQKCVEPIHENAKATLQAPVNKLENECDKTSN